MGNDVNTILIKIYTYKPNILRILCVSRWVMRSVLQFYNIILLESKKFFIGKL